MTVSSRVECPNCKKSYPLQGSTVCPFCGFKAEGYFRIEVNPRVSSKTQVTDVEKRRRKETHVELGIVKSSLTLKQKMMWLGFLIVLIGCAFYLTDVYLFRNDSTLYVVAACLVPGGVICYAAGSLMKEKRHVPPVNSKKFVGALGPMRAMLQ